MYHNAKFSILLIDFNKFFTVFCICVQKDCFEVYALVPGLLREEVRTVAPCLYP